MGFTYTRALWHRLCRCRIYSKVKTEDDSPAPKRSFLCRPRSPSSSNGLIHCGTASQRYINYITIVIFLEFFAWGLVTTILPETIKTFFGAEKMWVVLGLTQGLKGILSFLSAPLLGALSDSSGRKPYLLLTVASTCLPLPFLLISNLWWHVIVVGVSGAFAVTFSIVFAYVSDVTSPEARSTAYGQVSATFAASLVLSPALGSVLNGYFGSTVVFGIASIVAVLDVLFIVFFVPESLHFNSHSTSQDSPRKSPIRWGDVNPLSSLKLVFSSSVMLQQGAIVFLSYLPEAGQYQCLMLYLQNTIGFSKSELAAYIAVLGILSILMQTLVLGYVTTNFSQKSVILSALSAQALQLVLYGFLTSKWALFLIGIVVSYSSIVYPSISALISQSCGSDQQGAVQGMVTGVRSLCTGLGPAIFGVLFQMVEVPLDKDDNTVITQSHHSFPGSPFLVGSGLVLMALFVALGLPERSLTTSIQRTSTIDLNGSVSAGIDTLDDLAPNESAGSEEILVSPESPIFDSTIQSSKL